MIWSAEKVPASLDHILLGCSDLDSGIEFVAQSTGVQAQFGGVHPGRGTRNALLSLGELQYLEIIAPDPMQTGLQPWPVQRVTRLKQLSSPRLIGWAVHVADIDGLARKCHEAELAIQPIIPGSRKRDDGRVLNWKTLSHTDDRDGILPFFIQWSAGSSHPSADAPDGCHLENFVCAGPNPAEVAAVFQQLSVDVGVERAERPQLRARIIGAKGNLELFS